MENDKKELKNIPQDEILIINEFLEKLVFVSDSSTTEHLDLKLAFKALPLKINKHNLYRIDMINFPMVQKSLIAFQNDDQDELFNYYDKRSKTRIRKLYIDILKEL